MQILTPSGYKSPATLSNGDEVCAFDVTTGDPIVNHIENIDFADYAEWCRWWSVEDSVPEFTWYRINGSYVLFREQSIWRNGTNVCHARNLVAGDVIYDDADQPVQVTSIETFEDRSLVWYRFDISGDHSYIIDGLTVHNASRFWVGGTGTWDSSTTTHWAASSNGAGGQSVPGSADQVNLDGNSGGGTVTLNFGGTITIQSLNIGSFTGTFENSVNNNNITTSIGGGNAAFDWSGSATRTYKMGTATYTITGSGGVFSIQTGSNLTFTGGTGATIAFTGNGGRLTTSNQQLGTVSFGATSTNGVFTISQTNKFTNITITAPCWLEINGGETQTITNAVAWAGSSTNQIMIMVGGGTSTTTLAFAGSSTMQYCAFRGITATGSPVATNSFNFLNNSGITITGPSGGGGGSSFSGGFFV